MGPPGDRPDRSGHRYPAQTRNSVTRSVRTSTGRRRRPRRRRHRHAPASSRSTRSSAVSARPSPPLGSCRGRTVTSHGAGPPNVARPDDTTSASGPTPMSEDTPTTRVRSRAVVHAVDRDGDELDRRSPARPRGPPAERVVPDAVEVERHHDRTEHLTLLQRASRSSLAASSSKQKGPKVPSPLTAPRSTARNARRGHSGLDVCAGHGQGSMACRRSS